MRAYYVHRHNPSTPGQSLRRVSLIIRADASCDQLTAYSREHPKLYAVLYVPATGTHWDVAYCLYYVGGTFMWAPAQGTPSTRFRASAATLLRVKGY